MVDASFEKSDCRICGEVHYRDQMYRDDDVVLCARCKQGVNRELDALDAADEDGMYMVESKGRLLRNAVAGAVLLTIAG